MNSASQISVKYFSDFYMSYRRQIWAGTERPVSKPPGDYFDRRHTSRMRPGSSLFRRLARDYDRLPEIPAGLRYLVFTILMW